MADVKWIKIAVNMFDNRKIKQIESMPDGDSLLVIWVKLICLAGEINDGGYVYLTKEIAYTEEMMATQFNKPIKTIQLALKTFEAFGMIKLIDNMIYLSSWEKYQSTDKLAEIREQAKVRKQKQRQKEKEQKLLMSRDCHVTQCDSHAIELDKELDRERDKELQLVDQKKVVVGVDSPFEFWEKNMGLMTEYVSSVIQDLISQYGEVTTLEGMQAALMQGQRKLSYIEACCRNIHTGNTKKKNSTSGSYADMVNELYGKGDNNAG